LAVTHGGERSRDNSVCSTPFGHVADVRKVADQAQSHRKLIPVPKILSPFNSVPTLIAVALAAIVFAAQ
jgi:hypothetical protein